MPQPITMYENRTSSRSRFTVHTSLHNAVMERRYGPPQLLFRGRSDGAVQVSDVVMAPSEEPPSYLRSPSPPQPQLLITDRLGPHLQPSDTLVHVQPYVAAPTAAAAHVQPPSTAPIATPAHVDPLLAEPPTASSPCIIIVVGGGLTPIVQANDTDFHAGFHASFDEGVLARVFVEEIGVASRNRAGLQPRSELVQALWRDLTR